MSKELEIKMSNIENEAVDLLHQVVSFKGTTWENPFPRSKSYTEHYFSYKKYKNFLSNCLHLEVEPIATEYKNLKEKLNSHTEIMINKLSRYMESSGKTYQNHYVTILKWYEEDKDKLRHQGGNKKMNYDVGESL